MKPGSELSTSKEDPGIVFYRAGLSKGLSAFGRQLYSGCRRMRKAEKEHGQVRGPLY